MRSPSRKPTSGSIPPMVQSLCWFNRVSFPKPSSHLLLQNPFRYPVSLRSVVRRMKIGFYSRALKFYLKRVKPFRASRKRLFIPIKGGGDVSAASISRWIASTIKKAYSSLTDRDLTFLKIRPHELRALSTSWAFINRAPLADVLSAAFWKNATTFSTFYLRSFGSQQGSLSLLGPLVVAQAVVDPSNGQDGRHGLTSPKSA